MDYIGFKMLKSEFDNGKALEVATWCNEVQNATWQDMGDYYECVKVNLSINIEEKRNNLIRQYKADKAELIKYITEAVAYGDDTDELREELLALDEQFDADMEALKNGADVEEGDE